jgi:hypothetical protein
MRRLLSPTLRRPLLAAGTVIALTVPFRPTVAGSVQPLSPVNAADGRLGLCDVLPGTAPSGASWAQLAYNAGARINRWEFRWDRIEPQAKQWNFASDDAAVHDSLGAGLSMEGILIGTPHWAAAHGEPAGNGLPRGLALPPGDPRNTWASYVRGVVLHYRGQVHAWEVWNEPDLKFFWHGSPDQYFQLLKTAYVVIKGVDPSATVLMAGMVVPDLTFARRVLFDAAHGPDSDLYDGYFDAVAWHAYGNASLVYSNIERFRGLVASAGFSNVPLWVTEDGFPSSNPNGEPRQAAYVLQTIAYAFAAGAARVIVYRESDDTGSKTWGLISAAGQPRMGYVGFQVAARYFAHAAAVTYAPDAGLERFSLYQAGQRLTVMWSRALGQRVATLPAATGPAGLIDWQGDTTRVSPVDGQLSVTLPGATYNQGVDAHSSVVGSPPVIVDQTNGVPAGVAPQEYVRAVTGPHRSLAVLNQRGSPVSLVVSAAARPVEQEVVEMPPQSVQTVDLDLLAGSAYAGSYVVRSSQVLTIQASSDRSVGATSAPSRSWYGSTPPNAVRVINPGTGSTTVRAAGYGMSGREMARASFAVSGHGSRPLQLPPAKGLRSYVVTASQPILLSGSAAVPQPQPSWYAIHPTASHLSLFNPNDQTSLVDLHFLGAPTVTGQQLKLGPRHSFIVRTHGAHAVVVSSTRALAVAPGRAQPDGPSLVSQATTSAALATGGPVTHVALLNPQNEPAHVSYALIDHMQSEQHSVVVPPGHVATVLARRAGEAPRGVIVHSDVDIVAAPSP